MNASLNADFDWQCYPHSARWVGEFVGWAADANPLTARLQTRMLEETGTRLVDWIDHFYLPETDGRIAGLSDAGFEAMESGGEQIWHHAGALFPRVRVGSFDRPSLAIRVDSVDDFVNAHDLEVSIQGPALSQLRTACVCATDDVDLWVIERHGNMGFSTVPSSAIQWEAASTHLRAFSQRRRDFPNDDQGFQHATERVHQAIDDLGSDWACDLFFEAERRYWQSRNRAAQVQKARQDKLGLGWANHDHHTYRSSRQSFKALIELFQLLGFQCRERFYGGAEAGWGAQVLEQPAAGIVIFADVDLSPSEVTGDFAHEGLPPRDQLGTVGLWCCLHGEAILQAGMHHLECQFDFDAARQQLAAAGVTTMKPFTDFPHLKQAFTEGEIWSVSPGRVDAALSAGLITETQAARFRAEGCLGSHLEILQRDDGYKGFNQSGINEIILQTDPRAAGA